MDDGLGEKRPRMSVGIECTNCGRVSGAGARFCGGCGQSLVPRCPSCGADSPADAQFCEACGSPLAARVADQVAARKIVTIVFADLVGSTSLQERLDAESTRRLMDRYYRALHAAVEAHGGTVVKLLGDGVMAAFGVPRVAEDDAIRAVRAGVGMQQAFHALASEPGGFAGTIGLRVAINTGEVVVSADNTDVVGDPVNVASRLQEEAGDGDVLVGESTRRLVEGLVTLEAVGPLRLKGRRETVAAYRLVSLERPGGGPATPFVGRDDELRRLMTAYDAVAAARRARLVTILGSPGLGKSRLLAELALRVAGQAAVLVARCDAAGGATFAPLAVALRSFLRIDDGTTGRALREAIGAALGGDEPDHARITEGVAALIAGTPSSPEETFFVVRRLLGALAATQPVVLTIDDLQWAEPLLLDLTEHLVQWSTNVPLLVVAAARPELRETRSSLATPGGLVSDVVTLAGLDAGAATRLAASVVGADELPAAIAGRVLATSEGNPLFVGELVRMLVHDGVIKREGGRWITGVEVAALEMPPTIHALLAARIERLRPEDRTVLERAAVVGWRFSRTAIAHVLPRELHADLDVRLESLRRSELIEPDTGWFLGEPLLRFHHMLIRDAAYRRVLKGTRAELHARFADWVESRVGEAIEHHETIGWHLEQAHQHLSELGPIDAQGRALGERAARYLSAAGRRALARDDVSLAASLLGRALDRLDSTDPTRPDLTLDWCEALLAAGEIGVAAGAIDRLGRMAAGTKRLEAWHACFAGQLAVLTDPQALHATADAVAAAAGELAAAGDAAGEANAHLVQALVLARLGKGAPCEAALDRALAAARRANDRRRANAVLASAPPAALWGPSPVTRASGRCLDVVRVLRITQGAPAVEAIALECQAVLEALRGRSEAAQRMIASARKIVEELGIYPRLLEAHVFAGLIELLEGDAAAAESSLRSAYEGLRDHGLRIDAARAAALLGRALLAQGRAAEAEALSHESEVLAGDDLKAAIAWRGVRAEALASRGEHRAAIDFARAAAELAATTDALLDHADARLALAAALRAAGRSNEAHAEEAHAIELWEAKGATVLAERARRDAERSVPPPRAPAELSTSASVPPRRIVPNAATAHVARLDAAMLARDADALSALLAENAEFVEHATGVTYGQEGLLASWRSLLNAHDPTHRSEPLATLGDSLALCRLSMSASAYAGRTFDVGAYEQRHVVLVAVDAHGRRCRSESFAADRLGDAVTRLYERYAELLPEGAERERAVATARSVAALPLAGTPDVGRYFEMISPDLEYADNRTPSLGSACGAEGYFEWIRSAFEVADDIAMCTNDILGLRSDTLLLRWAHSGTQRTGGGAYERHMLTVWVFGADGHVARIETFDDDSNARALARFDELTAEPAAARAVAAPALATNRRTRRVLPNAATAQFARFESAVAARDAGTLPALLAESAHVVEHSTGITYDRQGLLASYRFLLNAAEPTHRHEVLATLGNSLALCRVSMSGAAYTGRTFDVAAYERRQVVQIEVDGDGRLREFETYPAVQLGEAVVRLYERYAELLPEGAERERAAATARSVAALPLTGPFDVDRYATALSPAIVAEDSRSVGFGSLEGAEAVLGAVRALDDLSEGAVSRVDDILGLRSDAVLVRWSLSGRLRAGGGTYERPLLELWAFGAAGLATHWVQFDADREEEALARFDEMTAEPAAARAVAGPAAATKKRIRRVLTNAATAVAARLQPAIAARDEDAIARLHGDGVEITDHPLGYVTQRQETLTWWRLFFNDRDAAFRLEPCATLGASLALCHRSWSGSGSGDTDFDIGAFESRGFDLIEVDAKGRVARVDTFATDRLGDAVARLYERYAELLPEGPERARAVATARSVAALPLTGPFDVDRYATALSPAIAAEDSRSVGFGSLEGAEAVLGAVRALDDLSEGAVSRVDDILGLRSDALLVSWSQSGRLRAGGGSYERPLLELWAFGAEGLLARWEQFDVDREDEALSRLDELIADGSSVRASRAVPAAGRVPANAATRWALRLKAAIAERDFDAYSALVADDFEALHHPTGVVFDRRADLSEWPLYFRAKNATLEFDTLATLGDSLALFRRSWSASGVVSHRFDVGPYESDDIILSETDEHGRKRRWEIFATRRLWDAVVRLYERYAELLPEGPARVRAAATACSLRTIAAAEAVDVDRLAPAFAPDIQVVDRRPAGTFFTHGAKQLLEGLRAWHTVGADLVSSVNRVLGVRPDALLVRLNLSGTNRVGGGLFERPTVEIWAFGPDGLIMLVEIFDPDHEQQALARFDELTAEPAATRAVAAPTLAARPRRRRVRPNAATINAARLDAAIATRSADAIPPLFAEDLRGVDHTTEAALERAGLLFSFRALLRAQDPKSWHEPLATLGDSLALFRRSMSASGFSGATLDVGAYEREEVTLIQTDEQGRRCWFETFATSQLKDAVARLYERYAELLPDGPERERAAATARSMAAQLGPIDVEFWTTTFSPIVATDIEVVDRRTLSSFSAHGAQALLDGMRAWLAVAVPVSRSVEDVLASHPSALLVRAIDRFTATEWAGGGDFELHCINLSVFGSDGLLTRLELLDADREDEALARFDELTAELQQTVRPVQRWVARNAATAHFASVDAALTAGDAGALSSLLAEDVEVVDHTSGASYGRTGTLDFWRRQLRVPGLVHRSESLATLGDSLAICRGSISGSGARGEKFDVGAFEFETVVLVEVDARGRRQRLEIFAANRLGDAIARLYACYAEHFARGTQQERAAAIARAIALLVSVAPRDRDAFRTQSHMFLAPGVEHVDRRTVGAGITRGAHAVVRVLDALLELSEGFSTITDDVIALEPGALLTKVTSSGTDRTSGGAFERTYTLLTVFDTDGRVARLEQFDVGREAQALARFLEVTARDDRVSYGHTGGQ